MRGRRGTGMGVAVVLLTLAAGCGGGAPERSGGAPAPPSTPAPVASPSTTAPSGHGHEHGDEQRGPSPHVPMDGPTHLALGREIEVVDAFLAAVGTVADAEAAGFEYQSPPGSSGAHYVRWDRMDDRFVVGEPEMVITTGTAPDDVVLAPTYMVDTAEAPAGFVGDVDVWHHHGGTCVKDRKLIALRTDPADCAARGGVSGAGDGWMLHVWRRPGWENPWGLFAGAHPDLPLVPPG